MDNTNKISQYVTDWRVILVVGFVIAAAIWGAATVAKSNKDRPCTRTVNTASVDMLCAVNSWSAWEDVSQEDPEGYACETYEVTQRRIGQGTRASSLTTVSGCGIGEEISSMNQTCQVEDMRTVRRTVEGIAANGTDCNSAPEVVIGGEEPDDFIDGTTIIGGAPTLGDGNLTPAQLAQLTELRRKSISAKITAQPLLVAPGQTSVVTWESRETNSCTVTATNNDTWSATDGSATTSPISVPTVYTLTCLSFENNPVDPVSVTVSTAPKWNEQ